MNDLLPSNATPQVRALSLATARLGEVPVPLETLWDPQRCPAVMLPWLAWGLSLEDWDSGWSEGVKRQVVGAALALHRHKGTPGAVERAVRAIGAPSAVVEEWFEYDGLPYHFRVTIDLAAGGATAEAMAKMTATVNAYKNARSWLDEVIFNLAAEGPVPAFAAGEQTFEVTTVYPL